MTSWGRLTSATSPESGTSVYYYGAGTPDWAAQPGNLAERRDAAGNVTCYAWDPLNRVTRISYPVGDPNPTPTKTFTYDAATVAAGT